MKLSRFTPTGIGVFQAFLDSLNTGTHLPWPESALADSAYSEIATEDVDLEFRSFNSRFELAKYLHEAFDSGGFRALSGDSGLWAWIACHYFREICPRAKGGELKPGASPRWIPRSGDFRRYYRHLVAGPFFVYQAHKDHPERAMALLCQRPGRPGDLVEQLASRQQVVTNATIMQVATELFVDRATGQQRKNANRKGRGGPRRLIDVLGQFDVTWDMSLMTADQLRDRLPPEFKESSVGG